MNETDVRETIVRPLLACLGYRHGTQANIRTEVSLRYDRAFLGHKNPKKDPYLGGRADYICDATSFGRWVVEVKAPGVQLTQDDVEQAHTYAAHPEISATYFLLTNGREFRLYATSRLVAPLLEWRYEEIDRHLMTLTNIVGYEALRKLAKTILPAVGKPLGPGLPPKVDIVGGRVIYGKHLSSHSAFPTEHMEGLEGPITGISVQRDSDGRLHATLRVLSPYPQLSELNKLAGIGNHEFYCAEEYLSVDIDKPSILQSVIKAQVPAGTNAKIVPGHPGFLLPFGFDCVAVSNAVGFVSENIFRGIVFIEYDYKIYPMSAAENPQLAQFLANLPSTFHMSGSGQFEIIFSTAN